MLYFCILTVPIYPSREYRRNLEFFISTSGRNHCVSLISYHVFIFISCVHIWSIKDNNCLLSRDLKKYIDSIACTKLYCSFTNSGKLYLQIIAVNNERDRAYLILIICGNTICHILTKTQFEIGLMTVQRFFYIEQYTCMRLVISQSQTKMIAFFSVPKPPTTKRI